MVAEVAQEAGVRTPRILQRVVQDAEVAEEAMIAFFDRHLKKKRTGEAAGPPPRGASPP